MITKPSIHRLLIMLALLTLPVVLSACSAGASTTGDTAVLPAGKAYAEGKEIYFSHTEASDPGVAEKLTNMMKSPVLHVPSLAQVPDESLSNVYVFENGVSGKGPFGFQPDVFDNPPGSQGYTPLREIILVSWAEGRPARELKSAVEVSQAESKGELILTETGIVVNMPFMVWEGGRR